MEIGEPSQGARVSAVRVEDGASFEGILMGPAGMLRKWPFMLRRNGKPLQGGDVEPANTTTKFHDGAWWTNEGAQYEFTNMPSGYYEMLVLFAGGKVVPPEKEPPLAESGVRGDRPWYVDHSTFREDPAW